MKTTVSSKGQIVLPAALRDLERVEPGQEFEIERLGRGDYQLVRRSAASNDGVELGFGILWSRATALVSGKRAFG